LTIGECTVGIYRPFGEGFTLLDMRLPQSINRTLSVYPVFSLIAGIAVMLTAVPQLNARQGGGPQLVCSQPNMRFGEVNVGQTETQVVTITNTGQTSTTISQISSSSGQFSTSGVSLPLVLAAGQSAYMNVTFTPSSSGWMGTAVNIASNASNPTMLLNVEGTGVTSAPATASPASLSFGQVALGSKSTLPITITNIRPWALTLTSAPVIGSQFTASGMAFPYTLNPGQSATLDVTFAPQAGGEVGGSVFIVGIGLNIPLTGTGGAASGQLTVNPGSVNFGSVQIGQTATDPITISASGASVTVYSATSSGTQFGLQGVSFPFTIPAGQSQSFNVAFSPQTSGAQSGAIAFTSNASNPQSNEALSGTGTQPTYSVNLYWNASSDVVGYNVYRATTATGKPTKINANLDANTAYTDNTVTASQTYYYSATSVNSSGQESAPSSPPVQVSVP
jgi:hypothetical protein